MARLACSLLIVALVACSGSTELPPPDVSRADLATADGTGPPPDSARRLEATLIVDRRLQDGPVLPPDGPAPGCKPYCATSGGQKAWFDGCTKKVLMLPGTNSPYYDSCTSCTAECKFQGQPAEGWYSSCTSQLISQVDCG